MPSRPATTVLLITRHVILRADFARGNALVGQWSQARPDGLELPILVEVALGLGPKPGKTVYVLSSDLWTQTLTLANPANMAPADLAGALNFEAEALSGLSAFESQVGYHALPQGKAFWIVQVRSGDLDQVDDIARKAGGRLGGVGHPGGLPARLSKAGKVPGWMRIEFWPDAVLFLRGAAEGTPQVQILNADSQMGRWRADWESWRHGQGADEVQEALAGPGIAVQAAAANVYPLDENENLTAWLTAWAQSLTRKMPAVPLLRPAAKPLSTERRRAIAVALAALVLLGCGALHLFLDRTLQSTAAEIRKAQKPGEEVSGIKKQIQGLEAKQKELETQADKLAKALHVLETQRDRLPHLLADLGKHYPEHLFVDKITVEGGEPCLWGRCLEPELADQFANKLSQCLLTHGWEVQAPKKHAEKILANGCPWSFEISFRSASALTLDTRVDTKKVQAKVGRP